MAYDLDEQEQIATLKSWWSTYGNLVTWLLIACLAAYASWSGWTYYQRSQAVQTLKRYQQDFRLLSAE